MTVYVDMADAEFAVNIPPGFAIAGGYLGGPNAAHTWSREDWARFPGWRLPIWVGGQDGPGEAAAAVAALRELAVPPGSIIALDMELRRDVEYVSNFGVGMHQAGYLVWVYGSLSSVFGNPQLNGYWVADFGVSFQRAAQIIAMPGVRACQDRNDLTPGYDASLVQKWTEGEMWHG